MMGSDLNCVVSSIMAHDDAKIMYKNKIRNICNFEFSRFNVLLFHSNSTLLSIMLRLLHKRRMWWNVNELGM